MALRQFLDKIEPQFEKGGRFEKWYALYEAVDTIFYSPATVTNSTAHVRDGIDLKRIMITVWLAVFPAMFFGMCNIGLQANSFLAANPGITPSQDWHQAIIAALAGHDPASIWDNFVYGAAYFIPIYFVTFVVGGFWEVLFATVRKHEVNEGFFVTSILFALILPADGAPLAGRPGHHLWCGDRQGSLRRYRQELPQSGTGRSCFPVLCLSGADVRGFGLDGCGRLQWCDAPECRLHGGHGCSASAAVLDGCLPRASCRGPSVKPPLWPS